MSAPHVVKTLSAVQQRFIDRLTDGVNLMRTNATEADVERYFHTILQTEKAAGADILDEVHAELTEAVTKHLMNGGVSRIEAEAWSSNYVKTVMDKAEKIRNSLPATPPAVKLPLLKLVGATMALAVAGIAYFGFTSGTTTREQSELDFLTRVQAENEQVQRATVTMDEFSSMVSGLRAETAAPVADGAAAPAAVPAPMALPTEIAAIAAAPVSVAITTSEGPQPAIHTNVAQVYRYAPPPVRRVMVQQWHIDHIYDHPDDERDAHFLEHPSPRYHKEVDVETDFGASAHIEINH